MAATGAQLDLTLHSRQHTPDPPPPDNDPVDGDPVDGDRWSTWDVGQHGPAPHPDWLVTELAAVDTELGVLKTGKEADVHLVERAVPGTSRSCLLAAKRYRTTEHRMFHRDAAYLEGRRVRRSRETRAMSRRTAFGRDLLAGQWATAEFSALCRLWRLGALPGATARHRAAAGVPRRGRRARSSPAGAAAT